MPDLSDHYPMVGQAGERVCMDGNLDPYRGALVDRTGRITADGIPIVEDHRPGGRFAGVIEHPQLYAKGDPPVALLLRRVTMLNVPVVGVAGPEDEGRRVYCSSNNPGDFTLHPFDENDRPVGVVKKHMWSRPPDVEIVGEIPAAIVEDLVNRSITEHTDGPGLFADPGEDNSGDLNPHR